MDGTTAVYLILIDHGLLICYEKDGEVLLPSASLKGIYKTEDEAKKAFVSQTGAKIGRGCFTFLHYSKKEQIIFYSAIIDLNIKENAYFRQSLRDTDAKCLSFLSSLSAAWDDGSRLVIETLHRNKQFEDAFLFIDSDSRFYYFSDRSKDMIEERFNDVTNIWQYDKPDVVVETLHGITGVESFIISASGKYRRGSISVIEDKHMAEEVSSPKPWQVKSTSSHFNNSFQNLFDDFRNSYYEHLKMANDYQDRLRVLFPNKDICLGLHVKDTTLLGSFYQKGSEKMVPLYPFNVEEFWDLFLSSNVFSFVIFQQIKTDYKAMYFITRADYETLRNKKMIFKAEEIKAEFFNNPHIIGTSYPAEYASLFKK